MKTIKLISLDLDGTLFNNKSIITEKNKQAIKRATQMRAWKNAEYSAPAFQKAHDAESQLHSVWKRNKPYVKCARGFEAFLVFLCEEG